MATCNLQGSEAVRILDGAVGTGLDQVSDDLAVGVVGGLVKGCPPITIGAVYGGTVVEEDRHQVYSALGCCPVQTAIPTTQRLDVRYISKRIQRIELGDEGTSFHHPNANVKIVLDQQSKVKRPRRHPSQQQHYNLKI